MTALNPTDNNKETEEKNKWKRKMKKNDSNN